MTYAVAVGEMFDGIGFYGPFREFEDAEAWADRHSGNANWWVVELNDTDVDGSGRSPLVFNNVDYRLLAKQHEVLGDLLALVRDDDAFMDVTILDGLLDMVGDVIPDCVFHPWNNDDGPRPSVCSECESLAANHADTQG